MLLIDSHEPKEIIEKIKEAIPAQVLRLKYGDYSFSDIAVERKTLADFFSSLKANRLGEQMENISRCYTEKYLLIEGFFDFSYVNNIGYLYSELSKIAIDFDVRMILSKDAEDTAGIIKRMYFRKNFGCNLKTLKQDKTHYAAKLFGITNNKLEILLSKFGSIKNIANADKKDFKSIKSIGNKTIEKIKISLNENILNQTQ